MTCMSWKHQTHWMIKFWKWTLPVLRIISTNSLIRLVNYRIAAAQEKEEDGRFFGWSSDKSLGKRTRRVPRVGSRTGENRFINPRYERERRMKKIINIEDARQLAYRRLPKFIFDFVDGGAEDEVTSKENRRAFRKIKLNQRVLVGVSERDISTTVLGESVKLPVLLAPACVV